MRRVVVYWLWCLSANYKSWVRLPAMIEDLCCVWVYLAQWKQTATTGDIFKYWLKHIWYSQGKCDRHWPAGEQRRGRSAMTSNVDERSWVVPSEKVACLCCDAMPNWNPLVGIAGFSPGMCRTRTQRQTSSVANTSDLPGTMSPDSPPSPIDVGMAHGATTSPDDLSSFSVKQCVRF